MMTDKFFYSFWTSKFKPSFSLGKRADANMWWIIIGAVIALIVMIVLLVMFTGKTGGLESGLSACEGKSGICVSSGEKPPLNTVYSSIFSCEGESKCYIGSPKKCSGPSDNSCGKDSLCLSYKRGAENLNFCASSS